MVNDEELKKIPYVPWLEQALQELIKFPVRGICMFATTDAGAIYSNYHEISMMDKLTIAGLIQQDATIDSLVASGIIEAPDEDSEDEK